MINNYIIIKNQYMIHHHYNKQNIARGTRGSWREDEVRGGKSFCKRKISIKISESKSLEKFIVWKINSIDIEKLCAQNEFF